MDVHSDAAELQAAFIAHAEETTAEAADRADERGLEARETVEHGVAHETILDYAEARSVDAIVMGTESKSTAERFVVGSVSQRVVPNAPAPELTVRILGS